MAAAAQWIKSRQYMEALGKGVKAKKLSGTLTPASLSGCYTNLKDFRNTPLVY